MAQRQRILALRRLRLRLLTNPPVGLDPGPVVGGVLFAWSMRPGHVWPFNYCFVWYGVTLLAGLCWYLCRQLPKKLDQKVYDD